MRAVKWCAEHVGELLFAVYATVAIGGILLAAGAAIYAVV
jgi:hypothetical protein